MSTPSPAPQWAINAAKEVSSFFSTSPYCQKLDAEDIAAIITKHAAAISEGNERLKLTVKAQLDELTAISAALGTQDGHSSVDHITTLRAQLDQMEKERDEARQWLAERPSTELYDRAVARNEELCSKLTAAESELAELRLDRDELEPYARFGKEILDQAKLACTEGLIGEEHEHQLELAAKLGAGGVRREPYDPNVHQAIDCEPGDLI